MKIRGTLGDRAVVEGGAIVIEIVTQYGTLSVPVRGFHISELSGQSVEEMMAPFEITIELPEWIQR